MAEITLRIIDGPNGGTVYEGLSVPVTIGREKDNTIVLDDERASRFHLKIFQDHDVFLLVDLESTNGTRVNGELIQIWMLRPGDLITIGKTSFLFGSREDIGKHLIELRTHQTDQGVVMGDTSEPVSLLDKPDTVSPQIEQNQSIHSILLENEILRNLKKEDIRLLKSIFPPAVPEDLNLYQRSLFSEFLMYIHMRLRAIIEGVHQVTSKENTSSLSDIIRKIMFFTKDTQEQNLLANTRKEKRSYILEESQWQNLLDLQAIIVDYMKQMENHS